MTTIKHAFERIFPLKYDNLNFWASNSLRRYLEAPVKLIHESTDVPKKWARQPNRGLEKEKTTNIKMAFFSPSTKTMGVGGKGAKI